MPRTYLVLLYTLAAVLLLAVGYRCNRGQEKAEKVQQGWLNLHDSVRYVGMNACRRCHEDIYRNYRQTGMGQSFGLATPAKSAAEFTGHAPIYDRFSDLYYKPFWRDSTLYVKEYRLKGKDTVHARTEKIDYIVGSGHHTNSHIVSVNGYLYQAPFTFYTQKGKWDLPPGYEDGYNTRFSRALGAECLTCHNGYPDFEEQSFNKYYSMPLGIDCERCHGPGSLHVQAKLQGKIVDTRHDTDFTIVNPRKLPYEQQIDVCQRCHLQGNAVLKEGKTFFDHKPGMLLRSVMDVFMPAYEDDNRFIMASHAERLQKSPCFLQTAEKEGTHKFNCITCHNPHVSVRSTKTAYFMEKCVACHMNAHTDKPRWRQAEEETNCITCHMPKSTTVDIPHVTVTDHYIRVVKENVKKDPSANAGRFKGLICYTDADPDALTRARAFLYFYEKFQHQPFLLDSAKKYLSRYSEKEQPAIWIHYYYLKNDNSSISTLLRQLEPELKDALANYQAGQAFLNIGQPRQAVPYLQKAVLIQKFNLDYRLRLGTALMEVNQFTEAAGEFKFVLNENPKMADAWNNLGFLYLVQNNLDNAFVHFRRALALNPDHAPAHINTAKVWLARNNITLAKKELKAVLARNPEDPAARQLLTLINNSR